MTADKKEPIVLGIIPARGGSKGIPKKNICLLAGKPLLAYTIEAALNSSSLSKVLVSTDSEEIAEVALRFGAEVVYRPDELAGDDALVLPVLLHAVKQMDVVPDKVVTLQPTSPLRLSRHIDEAVQLLSSEWDAVVSISEVQLSPYKMYRLEGDKLLPFVADSNQEGAPRQQLPKVYRDSGAIYVTWHYVLTKKNSIRGDNIRSYYIDPKYAIDIDSIIDLKLAEVLLKEERGSDSQEK
jgi:CMP-N,N'-diacetyllegionaminic acid synthase